MDTVGIVDSEARKKELNPRQAAPASAAPGQANRGGLNRKLAAAIVEQCKRHRRTRGSYERLGGLNPDHIANARMRFAAGWQGAGPGRHVGLFLFAERELGSIDLDEGALCHRPV